MGLKHPYCNIVVIGAGSVATHLAVALYNRGFDIVQVFSRSEQSAYELAHRVRAKSCIRLEEIDPNAELYLIALRDEALQLVATDLKVNRGIVVHTSGTLSMSLLGKTSARFGVIYPLQTFTKSKPLDLKKVPFCIEASDQPTLQFLMAVASMLSNDVRHITSDQRRYLHIAAVFACNFSNFMYVAASDILRSRDIDFAILLPLMQEFFNKIATMEPWEAQTGPAIREDQTVIQKHLLMLESYPQYREIYREITQKIIEHKHLTQTDI